MPTQIFSRVGACPPCSPRAPAPMHDRPVCVVKKISKTAIVRLEGKLSSLGRIRACSLTWKGTRWRGTSKFFGACILCPSTFKLLPAPLQIQTLITCAGRVSCPCTVYRPSYFVTQSSWQMHQTLHMPRAGYINRNNTIEKKRYPYTLAARSAEGSRNNEVEQVLRYNAFICLSVSRITHQGTYR